MWKCYLIILGLLTLASCRTASMVSSKPLSAGALSEEYAKSGAVVRSKYDGQEINVTGYVATAAKMPEPGADQGSVLLTEKEASPTRQVACWFSKDQAEQFAKIKGGQYLTVKGVFTGEAGAELRFCKLVRIE